MNTKLIAMYLPQYHCIPENDKFWGKGFTDWVTVKKANPLFKGHRQPRVPLNCNYYDLSKKENVAWQAKLAKEAGIYGFGVYHYWFNNDTNILTKPAELMRDNNDIDINYFLAWDNGNWKRSWSNVSGNAWSPLADVDKQHKGPEILIPYILGKEKDWENHYNYLRTHFLKSKYIKKDNKPIFIIFNYSNEIAEMNKYWDELAKKDGFDGVYIIYRNLYSGGFKNKSIIPSSLYIFNYEPSHNGWFTTNLAQRIVRKSKKILGVGQNQQSTYFTYNYDKIWMDILTKAENENNRPNIYHGAFVEYDDSPRRGNRGGRIVLGATPEKFASYVKRIMDISQKQGKEFVFLTAWNEWGEGAYLEPDTVTGNAYLDALKKVLL